LRRASNAFFLSNTGPPRINLRQRAINLRQRPIDLRQRPVDRPPHASNTDQLAPNSG
jgi:hypothetical protein